MMKVMHVTSCSYTQVSPRLELRYNFAMSNKKLKIVNVVVHELVYQLLYERPERIVAYGVA